MIEFNNVQVKYNDFTAIDSLSLTIEQGEFFTLLGPSGCGKTTTLRSLVGFVKPTKGNIFIQGEKINDKPVEQRKIGMVFQNYALFPTMNVYENIAFGLQIQKYKKHEIDKEVKNIAAKVELNEEQLFKKVSDLSGGQQQRVAIARVLVLKPKILVLDEPLSNLDAKLRKQLRVELKKLQTQFGITTIYVTHDQEEALTMSDRIAVFHNGRIEQVGTPKEIFNFSKTEFVCHFIGESNYIKPAFLQEIKQQFHLPIDLTKRTYIRPSKIIIQPAQPYSYDVQLEGTVINDEYYGTSSKISFDVGNQVLSTIVTEDNLKNLEIGSKTNICFNTSDFLVY